MIFRALSLNRGASAITAHREEGRQRGIKAVLQLPLHTILKHMDHNSGKKMSTSTDAKEPMTLGIHKPSVWDLWDPFFTADTVAEARAMLELSYNHREHFHLFISSKSYPTEYFDSSFFLESHVHDFWEIQGDQFSCNDIIFMEMGPAQLLLVMSSPEQNFMKFGPSTYVVLNIMPEFYMLNTVLSRFIEMLSFRGAKVLVQREEKWTTQEATLTIGGPEHYDLKSFDKFKNIKQLVLDNRNQVKHLHLPNLQRLKIVLDKENPVFMPFIEDLRIPRVTDFRVHYTYALPVFNDIETTDPNDKDRAPKGTFELADIRCLEYNTADAFMEMPAFQEFISSTDWGFTQRFDSFILLGIPDILIPEIDFTKATNFIWRRAVTFPNSDFNLCTSDKPLLRVKLNPFAMKQVYVENNTSDFVFPLFEGIAQGGTLSIKDGCGGTVFKPGVFSRIPDTLKSLSVVGDQFCSLGVNMIETRFVQLAEQDAVFINCRLDRFEGTLTENVLVHLSYDCPSLKFLDGKPFKSSFAAYRTSKSFYRGINYVFGVRYYRVLTKETDCYHRMDFDPITTLGYNTEEDIECLCTVDLSDVKLPQIPMEYVSTNADPVMLIKTKLSHWTHQDQGHPCKEASITKL